MANKKKKNKRPALQIEQLANRIMLDASGFAEPVFFGPTSYLSEADIPQGFVPQPDCPDCVFEIETFEDNSLDFGLSISEGEIAGPGFSTGTEDLTDSVDGDDGVIDGTGQTNNGGYSYFTFENSITVTLPSLMQSAGVVWTDGDTNLTDVIFEAFDQNGNSIGTINGGDIADDQFTGQTAEDSFFGITFGDGVTTGVTSFTITNVQAGSGIEIDHIIFANCSACCDIDLEVSKTVDAVTVEPGDTVTWTVEVTNNANAFLDATGVIVTDTLPAGITLTGVSVTDGSFDLNTGIWTLTDPLSPGETETLTLTSIIDAGLTNGTMLVNTAEVTAANETDFDSTPNNDDGDQSEDDEANAKVTVESFVDVELTKSVNATLVDAGDLVTWTIGVTNNAANANVPATGVTITDLLPAGVTFVSASPTEGTFDPITGTWTLATPLDLGEVETLTIVTSIDAGLAGDTTLTNTAQVATTNENDIDSTPGNDDGDQSEDDEANASIVIREIIDLQVNKGVNTSLVSPGGTIVWTIDLTNNGANANTAATGVEVTDLLPPGVSITSVSVTDGSFDASTGVWTLASDLAPGTTETLTLNATIDAGLAGGTMIVNNAFVSAANEADIDSSPNGAGISEDDADDAKTTVIEVIDLEVTKTVSETNVNSGDLVTWTIVVENNAANANTAATGVSLADLLPAGLTVTGNTISEGSFDPATLVWTLIDPLAPGESETLTITTSVNDGLAGGTMLENVVQVVSADQTDIDSTPGNDDGDQSEDDEANAKITIGNLIDLEVTKTVDQTTVLSGDVVTWTIEITNNAANANVAATGVQLADVLPSGVTIVNNFISEGLFNPIDFTWTLVDPLAPGETEQLILTTSVDDGLAGGTTLTNTAQIIAADQIDVDSTPNNDDGDQSEDDEDNATITLAEVIDLEVTKTVSQDFVESGDEIVWTIEVTNNAANANVAATGVQLQDLLPGGLTITGTFITEGTFNPSNLIWTLSDPLVPGEVETLTITTEVNAGLADGTMLENVVQVIAADQADIDSMVNNDNGDQSEDDEDNAKVTVTVAPQLMLSGFSYVDTNNDGIFQDRELPLLGVEIMLTGTDVLGNAVNLTTFTNVDGFYKFNDLNEGTYTVMQVQPVQFVDGRDTLGNLGGSQIMNDKLVVNLTDNGVEYNFGELGLRPEFVNKRLYLTSTPYTDWQYVDVRQTSIWYSFDAEHQAYLEINGQLPPGGSASYTVFDADMNVITSGAVLSEGVSIPIEAGAHSIQFSGDAIIETLSVDLTPVDVTVDGDTVIAVATAGDDDITLVLGLTQHRLTINDHTFVYDASEVTNFHIGGSTGNDEISVIGTSLDDTASVIGDRGTLTSSNYSVNTYTIEETAFIGGGGNDYAQLYGSLGADEFISLPGTSRLTTEGTDISMRITDFGRVDAYGRGGNDEAKLFGTDGQDLYVSNDQYTLIKGVGHTSLTKGFERVDAYGRGGLDTAELHGSAGNDRYISTADYTSIRTQDRATVAEGFEITRGFAVTGGFDDAYLFHLNSNDLFWGSGDSALLERDVDSEEYFEGFAEMVVDANPGQEPEGILEDITFALFGNTSWV